MAGIARFEDLVAWQKARRLVAEIHRACESGRIARDYALVDQMRRAAISIACNIAEGFERKGPGSFAQFLGYARGSCAELRTQLYLASDVGWLAAPDFRRLMRLAEQVAQLLGALHASQLQRR